MTLMFSRPVIEDETVNKAASSNNTSSTSAIPRKGKGSNSKTAPRKKHDELWNGIELMFYHLFVNLYRLFYYEIIFYTTISIHYSVRASLLSCLNLIYTCLFN